MSLRVKGQKPADPILIVVGDDEYDYAPTVRVEPGKKYDWVWIRECESYVIQDSSLDTHDMLCEISRRVYSPLLSYWHTDKREGGYYTYLPNMYTTHLPKHQWSWHLNATPWMQFMNQDFGQWLDSKHIKELEFAGHQRFA